MWIPDCGVIALERRVVGVRENLSGLIPLIVFIGLAMVHFVGVKKITPGGIKFAGFVCLLIILISYLLKLIIH